MSISDPIPSQTIIDTLFVIAPQFYTAAENEFGTKTIPARPFMSTSFDENKALINKAIQGEYNMIIRRSILYKSLTKF